MSGPGSATRDRATMVLTLAALVGSACTLAWVVVTAILPLG
ncbi:hypothetical protein [Amnibacterium sp.]|nr:hypothetical protein [Amnibacterium sp.]